MKSKSRKKLSRFAEFVNTILPHEARHLKQVQQMQDADNINILDKIIHNAENINQPGVFDTGIDKRKYSNLKTWIGKKLEAVDADVFFAWLNKLDQKIILDSLTPGDEEELIRTIKRFSFPNYYFIRFYELVQNYRYYLLIRVRYNYRSLTEAFLEKYRELYQRSKQTNQQLHEATIDIVDQYATPGKESKQWEEWLVSVFKDETLDGLNRYYAIVRLTFLYYNYREYDKLISLYEDLDQMIIRGEIYSRRILVNYYANRLMVHSRYNELDKAEYYGYLSIRHRGSDYLQYLNNLCAVLLRAKKHEAALKLMQDSFTDFRSTISPHNRIGFASFYLQCLNKTGKAKDAYSYGKSFLDVNRSDILNHRWHLFFTSLMQTMFLLEKYREMLTLVRKYNLSEKEAGYRKSAGYIPTFIWYHASARFMEFEISEQLLQDILLDSVKSCVDDPHKMRLLNDLVHEISRHISFIDNNFIHKFQHK
ncbi:MAG: hypothetical protein IH597_12860 [Bacteroidales bacterium]|nr:hypothetical protein [Bacteroidales bacterium]